MNPTFAAIFQIDWPLSQNFSPSLVRPKQLKQRVLTENSRTDGLRLFYRDSLKTHITTICVEIFPVFPRYRIVYNQISIPKFANNRLTW